MKFPNYLIISLAVVGAFSLIIIACSADNSKNSTNNNNTISTIGQYQIASNPNSGYGSFHVIDTQTGVVKTFEKTTITGSFVLKTTTISQ